MQIHLLLFKSCFIVKNYEDDNDGMYNDHGMMNDYNKDVNNYKIA